MARKPEIKIYQDGDRYVVNTPAGLSPSGRRQRLFFPTKRQAERTKASLEGRHAKYGRQALAINPALAEQAVQAKEILDPWGMTLVEAAKLAVEHRERQGESVTLADLFERHLEALAGRSGKYIKSTEIVLGKFLPKLGKLLVCDIDHRQIADVAGKAFPTAHGYNAAIRTISPTFNRAVREGWASENPCKRIEKRHTGRHEIRFLTVEQVKKVMVSCRDFRKDRTKPEFMRRDCRDGLAAVAIMLFSGVRPNEVTKLAWSDVDMDEGTIRVSNRKAKTDRSRHFEMPDTLKAWLATIPATERQGLIVPSCWQHKWKAIRRHAGFSDIPDALRKTFVTHHLAAYSDVNLTRSIIGHEVGDVLFSNYRGAVSKKKGQAFFEVKPASITGEKVVAMTG